MQPTIKQWGMSCEHPILFRSVPSGRVGNAKDAIFRSNEHFREAVGERENLDVQVRSLPEYVLQPERRRQDLRTMPDQRGVWELYGNDCDCNHVAGAGAPARQAAGSGGAQPDRGDAAAQVPGAAPAEKVQHLCTCTGRVQLLWKPCACASSSRTARDSLQYIQSLLNAFSQF